MCSERMTEGVGRNGLRDSDLINVLTKNLPRTHAGERAAARIQKESSLSLALLQLRAKLAQIDRDRADRSAPNWNEALLCALAEYPHDVVGKHDVANPERNPFRDAESRPICELEHCAVAEREG